MIGHHKHGRSLVYLLCMRKVAPSGLLVLLSAYCSGQYAATVLNSSGSPSAIAVQQSGALTVGVGYNINSSFPYTASTGIKALLWSTPSSKATNLTPKNFFGATCVSCSDNLQLGNGFKNASGLTDALLWKGTVASVINLNPAGSMGSFGYATSATAQVGFALTSVGLSHAYLWHGSAKGGTDIHPSKWFTSFATAQNGATQVGFGYHTATTLVNALLWKSTAASCINLNPPGFSSSQAWGASATNQAGYGTPVGNSKQHALLWKGTATSYVDLNPKGFVSSEAFGTNGPKQVGYADAAPGQSHAMLWNSSATGFVDLHLSLSKISVGGKHFVTSRAGSIDASGRIAGAASTSTGATYAIIWTPAPPP